MTDRRDHSGERPDDRAETDADTWSAWLPSFDATADTTSDTTGAASPGRSDPTAPVNPTSAPVGPPTPPGPPLPQSAGPAVPPAPVPAQQSYPSPAPGPATVVGPQPRSHLGLAILTLFMGLPVVSIAAVIAAAAVGSLWKRGRHADAQRASKAALALSIAALVLNVVWRVVRNSSMGM